MQLQFYKNQLPCLRQIKEQVLTQEQTLELRLNEELPDVGRILGTWGQVLVRGKQWHAGMMELSCGVMVWTMYQPEDGSLPQIVEAWIPFSFKWDLPPTDRDGRICVSTRLQHIDTRVVSAKKLILRASISALGEAWVSACAELPAPSEVPEDIQLLKGSYPVMLFREAGEKAFSLEEEFKLPEAAPPMEQLLRFSVQPELIDKKVMGDKVVFRGVCLLHILYRGADHSFYTWDFEAPFSQFSDLEREYAGEVSASVMMEVTSLETEADDGGRLRLRVGLTGQYLISAATQIELVEDAYSPCRSISVETDRLCLATAVEEQPQTLRAEHIFTEPCARVVDVSFYPHQPQAHPVPQGVEAEISGQFQLLYYDHDGNLQSAFSNWSAPWSQPAEENDQARLSAQPTGIPQALTGSQTTVQADVLLNIRASRELELPVITAIEAGEPIKPDPQRPSLILRRIGQDTLWQLAKETGSTKEAICALNGLQGQPEPERLLLIPVV